MLVAAPDRIIQIVAISDYSKRLVRIVRYNGWIVGT